MDMMAGDTASHNRQSLARICDGAVYSTGMSGDVRFVVDLN
jgi:hypothetical protein